MPDKIDTLTIDDPPQLKKGNVIPVVGNNLIFTPIWIIDCNNIKLAQPTKISRFLSLFSISTFLKIENINIKNNIKINIIAITPNSSEITEII